MKNFYKVNNQHEFSTSFISEESIRKVTINNQGIIRIGSFDGEDYIEYTLVDPQPIALHDLLNDLTKLQDTEDGKRN